MYQHVLSQSAGVVEHFITDGAFMLFIPRGMFPHVTIKRPGAYVGLATDLTRVLWFL